MARTFLRFQLTCRREKREIRDLVPEKGFDLAEHEEKLIFLNFLEFAFILTSKTLLQKQSLKLSEN
jgi:hypothetical protein